MSKYLVTGSAGFIGFHIARALLDRGDSVVGLDNLNPYYNVQLKEDRNRVLNRYSNYDFHKVDLSSRVTLYSVLDSEKPDIICHLAAQAGVRYSLKNPFVYERSNLDGFLNLIEWARNQNLNNFVFASSSSVYGGNTKTPFSESDRVDTPISLYAATKKADELMAHVYHHLFNIPMTGLRFFTVYGPWGRPDMALFKFTERILNGEPIEVYGNGEMQRDFTYIDDMLPAVLNALDTPREYEIYNLGSNEPIELMHFIACIEAALGLEANKKFLPMQPGDLKTTYADIAKAQRDLGFNPSTPIEDGVKEFVKWYKKYNKQ
jgi:UDP-glucuronate 4-epimerase